MSNLTITPEERAELREECRTGKYIQSTVKFADFKILRLLTALEAAEAQRDKALQMNAERQAAITETALNALLAGITGEEKSVGLNVAGYHCPYCGEISKTVADATAHDATCPKHPAVVRATKAEADLSRVKGAGIEALRRAEQAEAENTRLRAERDWLARELWDFYPQKNIAELKEAARRAVSGEGEPSWQTALTNAAQLLCLLLPARLCKREADARMCIVRRITSSAPTKPKYAVTENGTAASMTPLLWMNVTKNKMTASARGSVPAQAAAQCSVRHNRMRKIWPTSIAKK